MLFEDVEVCGTVGRDRPEHIVVVGQLREEDTKEETRRCKSVSMSAWIRAAEGCDCALEITYALRRGIAQSCYRPL